MNKKLKTAYCRSFQGVLKLANYCMGYRTPRCIEGVGKVIKLPKHIKKRNIDHVLLVTDPTLLKLGLPDSLLKALAELDIKCTIFSELQANPTDENVYAGYRAFKENGCEAIIAFGGGSSMDCAKAIAALNARPKKTVAQLQGLLKVRRKVVHFWAVPTTSGTGSETTVAAVITEASTHHKASINDPCISPRYAVLDPQLTVGLPKFVTATTGMDALCHAVESYTNWTYCTKLEKELSRKAVKLIYDNLYRAYCDGADIEARQNMQLAAFHAGRSFTRGCVGYVHAIGHTLSGLYGIPHGLAMSVILPHVLRQYGPAVHKRLAELAEVCGMTGSSAREKAEKFITWIEELNRKMDIPTGFDCIRDEDIPQIIKWADKEANPLYPVPVVWDEMDLRQALQTITLA